MQITINHAKDNDNGFTIDGTFFRTFRCLGTTIEFLSFCKEAIAEKTESYYDGETKDNDFTGDHMHAANGNITITTDKAEAVFSAKEFAKAAAIAVASNTDAWTIPGYNALNEEGVAEVHACNRRRYTELGDLVTELGSIA